MSDDNREFIKVDDEVSMKVENIRANRIKCFQPKQNMPSPVETNKLGDLEFDNFFKMMLCV